MYLKNKPNQKIPTELRKIPSSQKILSEPTGGVLRNVLKKLKKNA